LRGFQSWQKLSGLVYSPEPARNVLRKDFMTARPGDIFLTSDRPRVTIPPCAPHVYAHATVLFSAGDNVIRQRALDMLKSYVDDEDSNGAVAVLQAFEARRKETGLLFAPLSMWRESPP
jgi:hypothetical protein